MLRTKPSLTLDLDHSVNLEDWLQQLFIRYPETKNPLLRPTLALAQLTGSNHATPTGQSCLQQGMHMVEILSELHVDQETLAAAMLYHCARYADLSLEDIPDHINANVAKLITGVKKMDALQSLSEQGGRAASQASIDNVRKMLLAMVDDVRIVFIKLAERLTILRHMRVLPEAEKHHEAKITQDIYAPLANRLGIGHLKWELEDLSFRYLEPDTYSAIATALKSTRGEREVYVKNLIQHLQQEVHKLGIAQTEVSGRVKHIYSIYRKMQRKKVGLEEIYDALAFRILVSGIADCYAVLGHVHSLWQPISKEFDDYINKPKPNGYRSIHTAVIGPEQRAVEIQIRTFDMHQESELGVAAHWVYKEGRPVQTGYEAKIAWLRQLMDWQQEVTQTDKPAQQAYANIFDDRVYVFTPQGDVMELPQGATPLDFAYYIHTNLGHRCRGAKINSQIVPLTYALKTGECVEILTTKEGHPSRDWLSPVLGYLKTSRAKAKVLHWFRVQNADENLAQGQTQVEKELRRIGLREINYEQLAKKMHIASSADMFMSVGRGDTSMTAVINAAQSLQEPAVLTEIPVTPTTSHKSTAAATDIEILGVGNLLTHMAPCCKPIPGDAVIGYITQRNGVSIHRQDCANLLHSADQHQERLLQVNWGQKTEQQYKVDLAIDAYDRPGLIRDVTQVLVAENISILGLNCVTDKGQHTAHINLSIEVHSLHPLSRILARIQQLPNVTEARRV